MPANSHDFLVQRAIERINLTLGGVGATHGHAAGAR